MQEWTQEEAIAYECACEAITHLRAILTGEIEEELEKPKPDKAHLQNLYEESSRLFRERAELQIKDHTEIARIRSQYGARVREWFSSHRPVAAGA